jgi:molecular chaperone GrpE
MNDERHDARRHHNGRPRTRAQERIDALGTPGRPARAMPGGEELRRRIEELESELGEAKSAWQRTAADYANYRRRTDQEREASLGLANESLLRKLLTVVDDFDRALGAMPPELEQQGWAEGIWLVERKLRSLLESEGVTPIEATGKPFDPREHEAIVHQETADAPDETVIDELQKGYRIRDRVLRPSLVAVAKNTNPTPETPTSNEGRSAQSGEER